MPPAAHAYGHAMHAASRAFHNKTMGLGASAAGHLRAWKRQKTQKRKKSKKGKNNNQKKKKRKKAMRGMAAGAFSRAEPYVRLNGCVCVCVGRDGTKREGGTTTTHSNNNNNNNNNRGMMNGKKGDLERTLATRRVPCVRCVKTQREIPIGLLPSRNVFTKVFLKTFVTYPIWT
ncbi:LAFA_0D07624g1_1 [Lachancea sp. 'fantastica']|nr:LAFA_0D07624g1_1 [Lachancea sp. 'fantastica']